MANWFFEWDRRIFLWINGLHEIPWLNYLLGWTTFLGQFEFLLIAVFCVMALLRPSGWVKKYIAFAVIAAIVNLFACGLKLIFLRARPYDFFPPESSIKVLFTQPDSYAFPSGHAAAGFAAATVFCAFYGRRAWFLYVLALIVALSRIFVGVHYPSDVAAGALIGIAGGWIGIRILKRLDGHSSKEAI